MIQISIYDRRNCLLGEGPLWHPQREQLFWFDISGRAILSRQGDLEQKWDWPEMVTAAGWIDHDRLLVASQSALSILNIETGKAERLMDLEADNPATRSNDGRADPMGGFWIGTMGLNCEPGMGAIYRYYRGELRKLVSGIAISNAISFAPDGGLACYADTATSQIMKIRLDQNGWPTGAPEVHVDLRDEGLKPDGAVIDTEGNLWNAHWGSGLLCAYDPDGKRIARVEVPAPLLTCPAFGGTDLATLYLTSASELPPDELARFPQSGCIHQFRPGATGQPEHRVIL